MQQPPRKTRRLMLETSPLLCSLLGPEQVSTESQTAGPPGDVTTLEGGLLDRPGAASHALHTNQFGCNSHTASAVPGQVPLLRRLLTSCDREELERLLQLFLAFVDVPFDKQSNLRRCSCSKAFVVFRAKWIVHRVTKFAARLRGFAAMPLTCKAACVQASAAGCILLQCSYMYDIAAGCLNLGHGVSLDISDLCRFFPAVSPVLWTKCTQLARSLKQLLNGRDEEIIVFALLQAILVTSPEHAVSSDVGGEALAAVADIQLFYMVLLKRHCEAAYSYQRAADLQPALLVCISIVKRLASLVQKALTCHDMYSDLHFRDFAS